MTPERYQRIRQTLDCRQPDLTVVTDQMHKPRNIAALVRTADAVGISDIHLVWSDVGLRSYKGTAMGSQQWVSIHKHTEVETSLNELRAGGLRIYAAHFSEKSIDYLQVDYTVPCALLLGNEKSGVSDVAAELADEHLRIPMMGMVESYNVSSAAAIILAEAQNQRAQKGFYDKPRLSEECYWQTFFRWAHPQVARFCEQKGVPFPDIDKKTGEIVEPAAWVRDHRLKQ